LGLLGTEKGNKKGAIYQKKYDVCLMVLRRWKTLKKGREANRYSIQRERAMGQRKVSLSLSRGHLGGDPGIHISTKRRLSHKEQPAQPERSERRIRKGEILSVKITERDIMYFRPARWDLMGNWKEANSKGIRRVPCSGTKKLETTRLVTRISQDLCPYVKSKTKAWDGCGFERKAFL